MGCKGLYIGTGQLVGGRRCLDWAGHPFFDTASSQKEGCRGGHTIPFGRSTRQGRRTGRARQGLLRAGYLLGRGLGGRGGALRGRGRPHSQIGMWGSLWRWGLGLCLGFGHGGLLVPRGSTL